MADNSRPEPSRCAPPCRRLRVISVTSGKGGVGKTNIVANLAITLAKMGRKPLIIDADLSLANVDILLGLTPRANINTLLSGEKTIQEVLVDGPCGVKVLPAASGIYELTHLTPEQRISLLTHLDTLEDQFDVVLIDTGAGVASNVMYFNAAAQEIMVVVTPDNTSIADAYALIKILTQNFGEKYFHILLNMVQNQFEATLTFRKLERAASRFLGVSLEYAGFILRDETIRTASNAQKTIAADFPAAPSAQSLRSIAGELLASSVQTGMKGTPQFFWKRLLLEDRETTIQGIRQ